MSAFPCDVARLTVKFSIVGGKATVTVEMLMTHTSGFDADPNPGLWYGYVAR